MPAPGAPPIRFGTHFSPGGQVGGVARVTMGPRIRVRSGSRIGSAVLGVPASFNYPLELTKFIFGVCSFWGQSLAFVARGADMLGCCCPRGFIGRGCLVKAVQQMLDTQYKVAISPGYPFSTMSPSELCCQLRLLCSQLVASG